MPRARLFARLALFCKCGVELPKRSKGVSKGHQREVCDECKKANQRCRARAWRKKNREHVRLKRHEEHRRNHAKRKEWQDRYTERNRELLRVKAKAKAEAKERGVGIDQVLREWGVNEKPQSGCLRLTPPRAPDTGGLYTECDPPV